MIELSRIGSGYGKKPVIKNISATAQAGQMVAVIGPNGSGKSTLLKALAGVLPLTKGTLKLNGVNAKSLARRERAKQLAFLAQDRQVAPGLSVRDILELGRAPYRGLLGRLSETGEAAIARAVEMTNIETFLTRPLAELSGGEQARVLLARALTVRANILLADEPIAALDPAFQLKMLVLLRAEADSGSVVIVALHDLTLAQRYADEIWVMNNGQLISSGAPDTAVSDEILSEVFCVKKDAKGGFELT